MRAFNLTNETIYAICPLCRQTFYPLIVNTGWFSARRAVTLDTRLMKTHVKRSHRGMASLRGVPFTCKAHPSARIRGEGGLRRHINEAHQ